MGSGHPPRLRPSGSRSARLSAAAGHAAAAVSGVIGVVIPVRKDRFRPLQRSQDFALRRSSVGL